MVQEGYVGGKVTKKDFEGTLRAYKDSADEMKSEQRTNATAMKSILIQQGQLSTLSSP